jgi:hypothetical protein
MAIAETFARFVAHEEFKDVDASVLEHVKMLTLRMSLTLKNCLTSVRSDIW